ncbi:unnamed protein product [Bemisia tabaci]|uniref:Microtubule-associated protein n=1 Tax=Bemisia tabaci TaxID=7038 RepID=A0A9P0CAF5_BEMTA|nr:unnamed protein product [Bemisia tabaci]
MTEVAESGGKPSSLPVPLSSGHKSNSQNTDGDHDSGVDESTQRKDLSTNGDFKSPLKSPTKIPGLKKSPSTRTARTPTRSNPKTPDEPSESQERKKVPMNKIQVGAAPSPNLKTVTSKIGSLQNASYKPGGGKVKIESKKLDWKAAPRIAAKNETYQPSGGEKKIQQQKLQWNAKSKIGSLENATYKPGGGDKKIETIKLDFKDKAKPKIGSKENVKHIPGGGTVKNLRASRSRSRPRNGPQIEEHKLEIKAQSKVGSLDNVKYKPGGGDKKIFDDKEYLKQMAATSGAKLESEHASASQNRSKSTSRKSSRDRRSPIHLTPNGQAPKGFPDAKSEKPTEDRLTPGSSPLSNQEKVLKEPDNQPKSPAELKPPSTPSINTNSTKNETRTPPDSTDNNDNKIEQKLTPNQTPEKDNPPPRKTPEKIEEVKIESPPGMRPKTAENRGENQIRPDSVEQKPLKPSGASLEKTLSIENSGNQPSKDEPKRLPEVNRPDPPKPASPNTFPEKPPTPISAKPPTPTAPSKPATPSPAPTGNPTNSKPPTPQEQRFSESPQRDPVVTPQPFTRSEPPKNIPRPATGERRVEPQKSSPDFSPKFGIREPPSPKDLGRKLVAAPGEVRFDDAGKRMSTSPGKVPDSSRFDRPESRGEPVARPKTSDAAPKMVKPMDSMPGQRQEQYQTMRNLAEKGRVGSPGDFRQDSIGDRTPEPPRTAPPMVKKPVSGPPPEY